MIKTFCDRCGREIQPWSLFTLSVGNTLLSKSKQYEMCADCKKAFLRFLMNGKETEAEKC